MIDYDALSPEMNIRLAIGYMALLYHQNRQQG